MFLIFSLRHNTIFENKWWMNINNGPKIDPC